eukprot:7858441-Alexandrium_andersonii.AAC.1
MVRVADHTDAPQRHAALVQAHAARHEALDAASTTLQEKLCALESSFARSSAIPGAPGLASASAPF